MSAAAAGNADERDPAGADRLEWIMRRGRALTPRQTIVAFGGLALLSLAIAIGFWLRGAPLVLPFATLEWLALGAALVMYARHATDRESIVLCDGKLVVEIVDGARVRCTTFDAEWVRVERRRDERALIELSGQGQRVAVGRFVRPELRETLANELRVALQRVRSARDNDGWLVQAR